jgi:uncharacterized protein
VALTGPTPSDARLAGPDVVRAVALIGVVVMNYHGYLMIAGRSGGVGASWPNRLFDPFDGPLSTRFAATFVLVAGVGVSLLTRSSIASPERVTAARWRLARRGVLLYVVGLVIDEIWPGTILPYYGAMFVVAALIFTWRSRWVIAAGAAAAIAAAGLHLWRFERSRDGHSTTWITTPGQNTVRRYVFDVMVNGTHPLLPWLTLLCAGIVLGRVLTTPWWRRLTLAIGASLVLVSSTIAVLVDDAGGGRDGGRINVIVSLDPYQRSVLYVASLLGTALLAYAVIDAIAVAAPRATEPLRVAGQMTLTLYLAHIVVFNLLVHRLGWIEPAGLDTALVFAAAFWVTAIASAVAWQRRIGRGPAEYVYRAFGG